MLVIRFTPNANYMFDAWRWLALNTAVYRKARRIRTFMPLSAAFFVVAVIYASGTKVGGSLVAAAILLILLCVLTGHLWRSYPDWAAGHMSRAWQQRAPASAWAAATLEIDEKSVVAATAHASTTYQWSSFTDYSDLPNCVVLWLGRISFVAIPKESLSGEALSELLKIASSQLRVA